MYEGRKSKEYGRKLELIFQFFGSLYGTGSYVFTCLMIDSNGNIAQCTNTNVLCEKTLIKDTQLCLNKTDLPSYIALNSSTTIQISGSFTTLAIF